MSEFDFIILRNKKIGEAGIWLTEERRMKKDFPSPENKAFCKRLKRWLEFLLFAQIYAVLNQNILMGG